MSQDILQSLEKIVGRKHLLTKDVDITPFATGIAYGKGKALGVVFPQTLLQQWHVLQCCVQYDVIILMQATNTGLTGGSTPYGDDYDRDIIIVKSEHIHQPHLLSHGEQIIAFPGTSLTQLEKILKPINREPHSVIGSKCIGASVIGGICNNSGGALVQRGPAYSELALYAQIDSDGDLHLVNNIGIDLGKTPEEILTCLENGDFDKDNLPKTNLKASSSNYQEEVRQIDEPTPARFNANPDYLYEASGSAGKIAVFAVRLDTFPAAQKRKTFYITTDNADDLNKIRRHILGNFKNLPIMGEYMNHESFITTEKYARDVYLMIKWLGEESLPFLLRIKTRLDAIFAKTPFLPSNLMDWLMHIITRPFFLLIPKTIRNLGHQYEHHVILDMADDGVDEAEEYLKEFFKDNKDGEYLNCDEKQATALFYIRFVAFNAMSRRVAISRDPNHRVALYDVAYPRNDMLSLTETVPESVKQAIISNNIVSHFFCQVAHQFCIYDGKMIDEATAEQDFLEFFLSRGAKYPAEHNVGHKYDADPVIKEFYKQLDPCNSFNAGVGKMSKNKYYR